jgi:hypothetical protein
VLLGQRARRHIWAGPEQWSGSQLAPAACGLGSRRKTPTNGVSMGLAWGWHGVGIMGLASWGWHGVGMGPHGVGMGLAWGWHGVGMGLAWGWHEVGMGSTN